MNNKSLTIAIITKNRPDNLKKCLSSIHNQTVSPDQVFVIDNDQELTAKTICEEYKKHIPISYYSEPQQGAPIARNKAIVNCSTEFLGYVDDDCVLDIDWVKEGIEAIQSQDVAYIVGQSMLLNKKNVIAQAQFQSYIEWFYNEIDEANNQFRSPVLDTKNVILKMPIIRKHNIKFDNTLLTNSIPAGEDVDLGLQIYEKGLKGIYAPGMKVWHKEPEKLNDYLKKGYLRGSVTYLLCEKWNPKGFMLKWRPIKWYYIITVLIILPIGFMRIQNNGFFKKLYISILTKLHVKAHLIGFLKKRKFK